jgi:short-subunit dehydrogenase
MSKHHAIIVGFGPGNGSGIARAFAEEGFCLSLISRKPVPFELEGVESLSLQADAADPAALTAAIEAASAHFGAPEVLVYNAAAYAQGRPSSIEPASLTADFAVNVSGALASARAVLPAMRHRDSGTILFTGGGWALYPSVDFASMSLGKIGIRSLTFLLADELRGTGVRAGTVTVMGTVAPNTPFDPLKIGRAFVEMYRQPADSFQIELQFKGA